MTRDGARSVQYSAVGMIIYVMSLLQGTGYGYGMSPHTPVPLAH